MEKKQQGFSIQEVSRKLTIPKPSLRFWDKEFNDILVPLRTKGGQRRYTREHISMIEEIKKLREMGVNLTEIHAHLMKMYPNKMDKVNPGRIDFLANRVAEVVREEVYRFFDGEGKERVRS